MSFAFLIHPLTPRYMDRVTFLSKPFPSSWIEFAIKHKRPYLIRSFGLNGIDGCFVGVPLTSGQMVSLDKGFVAGRLIQACRKAEDNGAEILGLGGYTAIASNQGLDLVGKVDIGLTTGRAYTVAVVMEQVRPYLDSDSVVAVVGANGAIGSACSKLSKKFNLVSITRDNLNDVYLADIVITATSDIGGVIDAGRLKKDCVVCDAAKPSDLSSRINRSDITVIPGGIVRLPESVDFGFDFDLPRDCVYACMAEPMILALEGRKGNYCLGKSIDLAMVEDIGRLGKKHGFEVIA
jgi:fatty aldehyde-generating acyl-ACP reductase